MRAAEVNLIGCSANVNKSKLKVADVSWTFVKGVIDHFQKCSTKSAWTFGAFQQKISVSNRTPERRGRNQLFLIGLCRVSIKCISQAGKRETREAAKPSAPRLSFVVQGCALESPSRAFRVCLVNEIKIVFNFMFVCLVEGWVGRVVYCSYCSYSHVYKHAICHFKSL